MYKARDGKHCTIVTSPSTTPVTMFTKLGGNIVGITGDLVGRFRARINDEYGRWCGITILGRDDREILILTAYNVCQESKSGIDTLHTQQTALYMLKNISKPNPEKFFIANLVTLIEIAVKANKDIILTGDFNETVGMLLGMGDGMELRWGGHNDCGGRGSFSEI